MRVCHVTDNYSKSIIKGGKHQVKIDFRLFLFYVTIVSLRLFSLRYTDLNIRVIFYRSAPTSSFAKLFAACMYFQLSPWHAIKLLKQIQSLMSCMS